MGERITSRKEYQGLVNKVQVGVIASYLHNKLVTDIGGFFGSIKVSYMKIFIAYRQISPIQTSSLKKVDTDIATRVMPRLWQVIHILIMGSSSKVSLTIVKPVVVNMVAHFASYCFMHLKTIWTMLSISSVIAPLFTSNFIYIFNINNSVCNRLTNPIIKFNFSTFLIFNNPVGFALFSNVSHINIVTGEQR